MRKDWVRTVFLKLMLFLSIAAVATSACEAQEASRTSPTLLGRTASATEILAIDPNSEVSFFSLFFSGAGSGEKWHYRYFGDGRVQIDRYDNHRALTPSMSWQSQLANSDLEAMLDDIVSTGLFRVNPSEVRDREAREGIRRSLNEDAGEVVVGISLLRQDLRTGSGLGVLARRFAVHGGVLMPQEDADRPEYEALRRLTRLGHEVQTRAVGL